MDAYGYIEVVGLVPAIQAADAALKAANVEVVGKENTGKAMIAVIIRGEIGAVRAAIDAAADAGIGVEEGAALLAGDADEPGQRTLLAGLRAGLDRG